ncbi:hypothetical protein LTR56_008068 [Elasticomyces elasticus]|nr:hypothetical protein LTR56_008068 [Elasticomyces elasticus]KAK3665823.1 hypothetical protein LTR22_003454 [Elasticomyces elasticus]KAK4926259.1 hypothetical protein LTR49_006731 [Elasticomyces elasticus]KAK4957280.1 hypothetical protein LTR10_005240 [Elasticomyces elasticus]KAK4975979.1 hypothetical protein LTR42_003602 [Elasticomyces elasticus]
MILIDVFVFLGALLIYAICYIFAIFVSLGVLEWTTRLRMEIDTKEHDLQRRGSDFHSSERAIAITTAVSILGYSAFLLLAIYALETESFWDSTVGAFMVVHLYTTAHLPVYGVLFWYDHHVHLRNMHKKEDEEKWVNLGAESPLALSCECHA